MSFKLAFIDLDGTLLAPDKTITQENLDALRRLQAAGVQVVIASGRHHVNICSIPTLPDTGWTLSSNGAVVCHRGTGQLLLEHRLTPELVSDVRERAVVLGMNLIAYQRDGAYTERESHWNEVYTRAAGWSPRLIDFTRLPAEGFQKLICMDAPAQIEKIAPVLQNEFSTRAYVVVTEPEHVEFVAPTANKATGALALANELGLAAEQTLAFGDGNNDVELLRWAGLSVAMRHGSVNAHRAAKLVSPQGEAGSAFARAVDLALSA